MIKPCIDPVTQDITCPTCQQSQFTVFRRDAEGPGRSLNHCKCACGQLFVYDVDDSNRPVLDRVDTPDARSREHPIGRDHMQTIFCPRCRGERFTIFRREGSYRKTLLHFARCLLCEGHFTYKLNRMGQLLGRSLMAI